MIFVYIFIIIFLGCIWGFVTQSVIQNRGYDENWFWWGFFFGFIALIVAASKPQAQHTMAPDQPMYPKAAPPANSQLMYPKAAADGYQPMYPKAAKTAEMDSDAYILAHGGWKCVCGKVNPEIVTSCKCGRSKSAAKEEQAAAQKRIALRANLPVTAAEPANDEAKNAETKEKVTLEEMRSDGSVENGEKQSASVNLQAELDHIRVLKEYKALLYDGVLTQEEFEAKKKQLLNL